KKMQSKNLEYDQLYDVLALRVLVESVPQCYEALGLVHQLFKPIPGRFKDFIAMPKSNNYQSLHTVIIAPDGERIEIQIRTKSMHQVAERGIAAHWRYKEGIGRNVNDETKFNWLRELVTWHQQLRDSDEFLETVKSDLFSQEIYVFTPKGEVREFPEGATPLDFSYSIHTDLGNKTVGAKVNGRIVPLKHRLENGDTIEIITAATQQPSKDWLKFCVTTRAQTKIKQYIRNEERRRAAEMGMEIFEKEARKYGVSIQRYKDTPDLERALKAFGVTSLDELYIQIGYGKILSGKFIEAMVPEAKAPQTPLEPESFLSKVVKSALNKTRKSGSLVTVDGIGDMLVRYGRCCNPIPGDPIIGAISRGRGVTIHQATCRRVFEVDPERRVHVEWAKNMEASRQTRIRVISQDVPGLLKLMTDVFATNGININHADISTSREKRAICNFDVTVKNKSQVLKVVSDLSKIRGVIQVDRISHE
ncbi:MAG: TGS domain-containing protein, partial [Bdellovibrionales bacterium]|nr:TGS domain-containing protein [Bdellovibrionales bacterium]